MNEGQFSRSIGDSYDLFDKLGAARLFRQPTSLAVSKEFNSLALDPEATYAAVFRLGLSLSHYNVLLRDFSYFQFSRVEHDEVRLAFYPSPYGQKEFNLIDRFTALLDKQSLDFETYSYVVSHLDTNPRRPLIRYEHSKSQYVPGKHPASHIHFGTYGEDRWIVRRRLSPYAFSLLVARLYFSEDWEALTTEDHRKARLNELDSDYFSAREACTLMDSELFGVHEERQFHFL